MDNKQLAQEIIKTIGGPQNIVTAANCITRLRTTIANPKAVDEVALKKIDGVLGIVFEGTSLHVVLGPGKARKVTEEVNAILSTSNVKATAEIQRGEMEKEEPKIEEPPLTGNAFVKFFKRIGRWFKHIKWKRGLKHIGNIFGPLIPGFIMFGLSMAIANIVVACVGGDPATLEKPGYEAAHAINLLFSCFGQGFFAYLGIFTGINTAKEFKISTIVGGTIGGISALGDLIKISQILGWTMDPEGLTGYIMAGRGGILAVILAVLIAGYIERFIKKHMPDVLDMLLTTFLTVVISGSFFIFAIMPLMGFISEGIVLAITHTVNSEIVAVRIITGFFAAGFFQMLVMFGLHWGLSPFYTECLTKFGNVTIYPIFAMADGSQFGAAIALFIKARKYNHPRLKSNVRNVLVPSFCGVSEPLIFGASLPLVKPFLPIGLGAAGAGMLVAYLRIGSTAIGPSGPLAIPLMTYMNNQSTVWEGMVAYIGCWALSIILGFVFTMLLIREKDLDRMPRE